jgi:hypothetical protein
MIMSRQQTWLYYYVVADDGDDCVHTRVHLSTGAKLLSVSLERARRKLPCARQILALAHIQLSLLFATGRLWI